MTLENVPFVVLAIALLTNLIATAYIAAAIWRVSAFRRRSRPAGSFRPPVTILKPVYGLEAGLYENLRSFCRQDYPEYQVIFGVRHATDPALPVIGRLIEEFPGVDLSVVVDAGVYGPNLKVSNLSNIYRTAKHACIVIADSDMRVGEHYLSCVVAPFEDSRVGVVTCLYSGIPAGGLASTLGCMFVNEFFLPSVLVSAGLREIRFGLGATIAVRRDLLERIGGFKRLSQFLADDHMLGRLVADEGFRVVLSDFVVENVIREADLRSLFVHELRWARTVRTVEPLGHAFSFFMYGIPMALLGALAIELTTGDHGLAAAIVGLAVFLRGWMHYTVSRKLGLASANRTVWLVPARDMLCFAVWAASFFGRRIVWKDEAFTVNPNGHMTSTASTASTESNEI